MKILVLNCNNLNIQKNSNNDLNNKIESFVFIKDKKLYLGSYLIKLQLLKILNLNSQNYELVKNKYGKPYFKSKIDNSLINFNISHSDNYVILFYNNNLNVGVDIVNFKNSNTKNELIINNLSNTLSNNDLILVNKNSNIFFKIWAFKEALLKYIGVGILDKNLADLSYSNLTKNNTKINIINFNNVKLIEKYYYLKKTIVEFLVDQNYYLTICFDFQKNDYIEFEYVTPII